jgi:hypothetical protein
MQDTKHKDYGDQVAINNDARIAQNQNTKQRPQLSKHFGNPGAHGEHCTCFGIQPNNLVTSYLHWTFRSSFMAVLFSAATAYFIISIVFAFLLWINGVAQPMCVQVSGSAFSNYTNSSLYRDFGDALALSWTTLTTVVRILT